MTKRRSPIHSAAFVAVSDNFLSKFGVRYEEFDFTFQMDLLHSSFVDCLILGYVCLVVV